LILAVGQGPVKPKNEIAIAFLKRAYPFCRFVESRIDAEAFLVYTRSFFGAFNGEAFFL